MLRRRAALVTSLLAFSVASCGGGSPGTFQQAGPPEQAGPPQQAGPLTVTRPEPAGSHCSSGGRSVTAGTDTNEDGVLEVNEPLHVAYACNPAPLLFDRRDPGTSCSGGGLAIRRGPDSNGNGVLDDSEVSATETFCGESAPAGVAVADHGAGGDGVTDDTLALRSALLTAGRGGTVVLAPGRTYLISAALYMRPGQTLWGYGARIRRADEIRTSTATSIRSRTSPVKITVADASRFWVGQTVGIFNGVLPAGAFDPSVHEIVDIAGNTLTLGTDFITAFPRGGTVVSSHAMLADDWSTGVGSPPSVAILGVELDGNRAGNGTFQRWELHQSIYLTGDATIIRECFVHDAQADGIILGGTGSLADENIVVQSSGNAIHFSGSTGAAATRNYVKDCNLAGPPETSPIGHQDGCIILSDLVASTTVKDNYIEAGISGVGSIDSIDNSGVVIRGNTIKDCGLALEAVLPDGESVSDVEFSANYVFGAGEVAVTGAGLPAGPRRFIISDNYLENTTIRALDAQDVTISGNTIWTGGSTVNAIETAGSTGVAVQGNVVGP